MNNITKRGWFVLGFVCALLVLVAFWLMGHFWVNEGGICWGSMADCMAEGLGK